MQSQDFIFKKISHNLDDSSNLRVRHNGSRSTLFVSRSWNFMKTMTLFLFLLSQVEVDVPSYATFKDTITATIKVTSCFQI